MPKKYQGLNLYRHVNRNKRVFDTGVATLFIDETVLADGVNLRCRVNFVPIVDEELNQIEYVLHMITPLLDLNSLKQSRILQAAELAFFIPTPVSCEVIKEQYFGLTRRESECLYFFIRGGTVAEVASKLARSTRTIEKHLEHVRQKFDCRTKSDLVERAIDIGFFDVIPDTIVKPLLSG